MGRSYTFIYRLDSALQGELKATIPAEAGLEGFPTREGGEALLPEVTAGTVRASELPCAACCGNAVTDAQAPGSGEVGIEGGAAVCSHGGCLFSILHSPQEVWGPH
jgi:hypothetical protein